MTSDTVTTDKFRCSLCSHRSLSVKAFLPDQSFFKLFLKPLDAVMLEAPAVSSPSSALSFTAWGAWSVLVSSVPSSATRYNSAAATEQSPAGNLMLLSSPDYI